MGQPRVTLNEARLLANLAEIFRQSGGRAVFPVLKADAYGHGANLVARSIESHFSSDQVPYFCLARLGEALDLRRQGVQRPLLVLSQFDDADFDLADLSHIDFMAHSFLDLERIKANCERLKKFGSKIHINFNTGMNRLGFVWSDAVAERLSEELGHLAKVGLSVVGLSSHLARGEEPISVLSIQQVEAFSEIIEALKARWKPTWGALPRWIHIENSGGLFNQLAPTLTTACRPGIHLFNLEPVMTVQGPLRQLTLVPQGQGLGYGHRFIAKRETLVGTVALGYADGVDRRLSRDAQDDWTIGFVVDGERVPVAGTVSMDLCMVDLSGHSKAEQWIRQLRSGQEPKVSDAAFVCEQQSAAEIAAHLGTIAYEVYCSIGHRLPRHFDEVSGAA
jgi:alanine racemase